MKSFAGLLIACTFLPTACSKAPETPPPIEQPAPVIQWTSIAPETMNETQTAQLETALSAVNAMASELMGELTAALDSDDPATAITSCAAKAPTIASDIGRQYGVQIGRTSFRLRNQANIPPDWADSIVENRLDDPVYLAGPDGELGAMLPIRLKSQCLMCHGAPEDIDASIDQMLAERYPYDTAVGFAKGDLRGWFWVEVPPVLK